MSYVYALLSAAAFGAGDFLGGLAARAAHWARVALVAQAAAFVALVVMALAHGGEASSSDLAWGAVAGLGSGVGVSLLYRALAAGQMGMVAPITALCAIVLPAVFSAFTDRVPGVIAILGIVLSLPALALISGEFGAAAPPGKGSPGRGRGGAIAIALAAGVGIAAVYVCLKQATPESGLWPVVVTRAVSTLLCAAYVAKTGPRPAQAHRDSRATLLSVGAGVVDGAANALFVLAIQGSDLAVVATLTSLYPAATIVLAWMVLGERLARVQRIGLCLAAIAVAAIAHNP